MSSPTTNWRMKDSVRRCPPPFVVVAGGALAETDSLLDLQHYIFSLTYQGRSGLCPKNEKDAEVHRVLDVGSGTGNWAAEFGTRTAHLLRQWC
jgi:hypothetical protein